MCLPYGITSRAGYFQEESAGSSPTAGGKRFALSKRKWCIAEACIAYLGHVLSAEGIAKGANVNDVIKMLKPTDVTSLKSFLNSVQFYVKFLPDLGTMAKPLHRLTKKGSTWNWGPGKKDSFQRIN